MTRNKKVALYIGATIIILYMLRNKLAKSLTNTSFGLLSDQFFNFIGGLEGFEPVAKPDYKQWSIGYGSGYNWDENRPVQKGDVINQDTAKRWLLIEAQKYYDKVRGLVKVPINDNQLIALSSFAYNVGIDGLAKSTLLKLLNSGADDSTVAAEFDKWVYAGNVRNTGLEKRRTAEKTMFLS
jgi:GH24 family phage-related lysozyme (muramidase)